MSSNNYFLLINDQKQVIDINVDANFSSFKNPMTKEQKDSACVGLNYHETRYSSSPLLNRISDISKNPILQELCAQLNNGDFLSKYGVLQLPTIHGEQVFDMNDDIMERYKSSLTNMDWVYNYHAFMPEALIHIAKQQTQLKNLQALVAQDSDIIANLNSKSSNDFSRLDISSIEQLLDALTLKYSHPEKLQYWVDKIVENPDYFIQCSQMPVLSKLDISLKKWFTDRLDNPKTTFIVAEYDPMEELFSLLTLNKPKRASLKKTEAKIFYSDTVQEALLLDNMTEATMTAKYIEEKLNTITVIFKYEGGKLCEILAPKYNTAAITDSSLITDTQIINKFNIALERVSLQLSLATNPEKVEQSASNKFKL